MHDARNKRRLKPRPPTAVAPIAVSDESAPAVVGLTPRRFRELVARLGVAHVRDGHRVIVLAEDLRAALAAHSSTDDVQQGSGDAEPGDERRGVDGVLRLVGLRRAGGAR